MDRRLIVAVLFILALGFGCSHEPEPGKYLLRIEQVRQIFPNPFIEIEVLDITLDVDARTIKVGVTPNNIKVRAAAWGSEMQLIQKPSRNPAVRIFYLPPNAEYDVICNGTVRHHFPRQTGPKARKFSI